MMKSMTAATGFDRSSSSSPLGPFEASITSNPAVIRMSTITART
jgi:hypothetical protein